MVDVTGPLLVTKNPSFEKDGLEIIATMKTVHHDLTQDPNNLTQEKKRL